MPDGLKIKYLALDKLTPYANNARVHPPAQIRKLRASLAEFGWTNPILHADGQIIAGHGRLVAALAMRDAGQAIMHQTDANLAPTIDLSHLSPDQRRAYVLTDNRTAEDAEWDVELLREELTALWAAPDIDLDVTGFDYEQLREVIFPKPDTKDIDASQKKLDDGLSYQVIIECTGEEQQADLLEELRGRELKCRPLIA
jgi:ParB-like chromosome segregation protein Spo0J